MRFRNNKNQLKILLIIAIVITLITGLSATYAFFIYRGESSNISLEGGELKISFANGKNYLNVENSYPVSDATGMISPYYSDFTVAATTTDVDVKYEIQLVPNSNNTIDTKYIKVYLTDQHDNKIKGISFYNELAQASYNEGAKTLYTDYITENTSLDFRLRVWIDEGYNTTTSEDFGFTIYLYAVNYDGDALDYKIIKNLALTDSDVDGTRFVYGENVENNYVWYSGKLWRIVGINNDGSIKLVTQGSMTMISFAASSTNTDYSSSQVREWLNSEFLPVLENADSLLVDSTWDYTTYESFPTEKLKSPNIITGEKVGLLNIYEFMMTGGTDSADTSKTFLENSYAWRMMSPKVEGTNTWVSAYNNYAGASAADSRYGIRPSVNLISNIEVESGTGTKTDPYTIVGDKKVGYENELLNDRISGEYIRFNNVLYRIVGIENGLTKVTIANNVLTTSKSFGASANEVTFSPNYGIGLYLQEWYEADETSETYATTYIAEDYKKMIATASEDNVVWYAGPDTGGTGNNYKKAKTGTPISATIGLGRYGEMFSSNFGENYSKSTSAWFITKYSANSIFIIYSYGYGYYDTLTTNYHYGVRPSFYLKSDVKIGDVNGDGDVGNGMPNKPYEIYMETPADTTKPVCVFSEPSSDFIETRGTATYTIECTDDSSFSDSEITASDITLSTSGVVTIGTPTKSTITGGYKYTITVTGAKGGTTTLTLKAGVVSDSAGNTNNAVTSSEIDVKTVPEEEDIL